VVASIHVFLLTFWLQFSLRHATCPAHPIFIRSTTLIIFGEAPDPVASYSPPSCCFLSLRVQYSRQLPVS
jgi:hypothetical protein